MRTDILLDENMDLAEGEDFDLLEGESLGQHQQLLLLCPKGSFKENPDTGVGLMNYLESENPEEMFATIRRQFADDGMQIKALGIKEGKIYITAV